MSWLLVAGAFWVGFLFGFLAHAFFSVRLTPEEEDAWRSAYGRREDE